MKTVCLKLISFYRLAISPFLSPCCRFAPTCSSYAHEAIEKKGMFKGIFLSMKRILRCHPLSQGGWDPVE